MEESFFNLNNETGADSAKKESNDPIVSNNPVSTDSSPKPVDSIDLSMSSNEGLLNFSTPTEGHKDDKKMGFGNLFSFGKKKEGSDSDGINKSGSDSFSGMNAVPDINNTNSQSSGLIIDNASAGGDIFQDLALGDLNFGEFSDDVVKAKEPFDILVFTSKLSNVVFWLLFLGFILFYGNIFIKTSNYEFISEIPGICEYIGSSIEGFENTNCRTLPVIKEELIKSKDEEEKKLSTDFSVLIPKKVRANYILSSEEAKFIMAKTSESRISVNKMIEDFEAIRKNSGGYKGENIECDTIELRESGDLSVSCVFFGSSITDSSVDQNSQTSRGVALDFLTKLQTKGSNFSVTNYPDSIDIAKYSGTEGIKMIFSTTSNLKLNLKYTLSTKL